MTLRPYQQAAFEAATEWLTNHKKPALIEAATGAGKSHIIAALAHWEKSGKVLCLAPSKELVEQNHAKYCAIEPASIFSASAGSKSTRYPVVFGSPLSVKNNIRRFKTGYSLIIIDEAHGITPTIRAIVEQMPDAKIIGLTATPYRTQEGYIYQVDDKGRTETEAYNPFFHKLIYRITAPELIEMGFLTPPIADIQDGYDTSGLVKAKNGKFTPKSIEATYRGHGRLTADIVAKVVNLCHDRKGVMFFAASIEHAQEILASLPKDNARLITGESKDRDQIINDFKAQKFKYIVNRDVLTTGFDAPHVDALAILRRTESASLLQQIIGRGMRLAPDKENFLLLDFAENIETHFPDGDVFAPQIKSKVSNKGGAILDVLCPACSYSNEFKARENKEGLRISEDGYFLDLAGNKLEIPAHYGRRCQGFHAVTDVQCDHRWQTKECPECGHENDIAARFCESCKAEIIDPNEKLKLDFKRIKASPSDMTSDKVLKWELASHISQKGNTCLRVKWVTECRTFDSYFVQGSKDFEKLSMAAFNGRVAPSVETFLAYKDTHAQRPETITSYRPKGEHFFKITAYNEPLTELEA